MKIRTIDQLLERVDRDRIWRIREIVALTRQCELRDLQPHVRMALRKSFLAMLYAHWEGFVKNTADNYLEFVAMQGLSMGELESCFLSLYFKNSFDQSSLSKKNSALKIMCERMIVERASVIRIEHKNVINTHSNLNFEVLEEITSCLGLDISAYEARRKFIDGKLVARRNKIAHGNHDEIDDEEMNELRQTVVDLMDTFKTQIENAAAQKAYRRSTIAA
jgi:hypothetical protein